MREKCAYEEKSVFGDISTTSNATINIVLPMSDQINLILSRGKRSRPHTPNRLLRGTDSPDKRGRSTAPQLRLHAIPLAVMSSITDYRIAHICRLLVCSGGIIYIEFF